MNQNKIIHIYFTPLALLLVLMAIIFSKPSGDALNISLLLLFLSLINNLLLPKILKKVARLSKIRMIFNVLINILLVYNLVIFWGPIWYLFLLTPLATAVYSDRTKTLITSLLMSMCLGIIFLLRGVQAYEAWGQILTKMLLILFLSLFVNSLVLCRVKSKDA